MRPEHIELPTAPTPRPRRVFLHIGAPKTGSTYLQDMLWNNLDVLATAGIHVPGDGQHSHFRFGRDVREVPRDPRSPEQPWEGELERLIAQIEAADEPTAIITEERLCGASAEQAARLLDRLSDFEVHVVYGVRSFATLLTSAWQQTVKHRDAGGLDPWLEQIRGRDPEEWFWRAHDVRSVLSRWAPAEPGRVHVITFPGADRDRDELWRRFAGVVGAPVRGLRSVGRPNRSLGFPEAALLSRIQAELPPDLLVYHREGIVHWFIAEDVLGAQRTEVPIVIPDVHRGWISEETADRVEYLRTAGHDVVGDLDDLADADDDFGDVDQRGLESAMLDAAVSTISGLVTLDAADRVEKTRLEERIVELEANRPDVGEHGSAPTAPVGRGSRWLAAAARRLRRMLPVTGRSTG